MNRVIPGTTLTLSLEMKNPMASLQSVSQSVSQFIRIISSSWFTLTLSLRIVLGLLALRLEDSRHDSSASNYDTVVFSLEECSFSNGGTMQWIINTWLHRYVLKYRKNGSQKKKKKKRGREPLLSQIPEIGRNKGRWHLIRRTKYCNQYALFSLVGPSRAPHLAYFLR